MKVSKDTIFKYLFISFIIVGIIIISFIIINRSKRVNQVVKGNDNNLHIKVNNTISFDKYIDKMDFVNYEKYSISDDYSAEVYIKENDIFLNYSDYLYNLGSIKKPTGVKFILDKQNNILVYTINEENNISIFKFSTEYKELISVNYNLYRNIKEFALCYEHEISPMINTDNGVLLVLKDMNDNILLNGNKLNEFEEFSLGKIGNTIIMVSNIDDVNSLSYDGEILDCNSIIKATKDEIEFLLVEDKNRNMYVLKNQNNKISIKKITEFNKLKIMGNKAIIMSEEEDSIYQIDGNYLLEGFFY